ncbi:MAG: IS4 family transposase [Burkholderiales bacterium]|nr:IS4 family transposase [Burkholderiales bacterium]
MPQRAGSSAALEGTYRFFANDKVTPEALFESHMAATIQRAALEPEVLVVHDTTEFRFGGEQPRRGMGWINSEHIQGFLGHFSMCVTREGRPLGSVGLHAWVRQGTKAPRLKTMPDLRDPDRESQRWQDAALLTGERLHGKTSVIHLMDREGDQFELLSCLLEHDQRFVIRLAHDRRLKAGRGRTSEPMLFESISTARYFFSREIAVAARAQPEGSNKLKAFPPRKPRTALLEVRAGTRQIFTSHMAPAHVPASLTLQVVEVREVNAPEGEAPIIWRLVTTEPIDTEAQVAAVIDAYCLRWLIEEFFKALKTGCRYQQLQLESIRGLLSALSIEAAVAWKLLLLRWSAHHRPDADATGVMSAEDLRVLQALSAAEGRRAATRSLDVQTALLELARLGGHIKNNGAPGWLVLRRGFDALVAIRKGWELARGS